MSPSPGDALFVVCRASTDSHLFLKPPQISSGLARLSEPSVVYFPPSLPSRELASLRFHSWTSAAVVGAGTATVQDIYKDRLQVVTLPSPGKHLAKYLP